MAAQLRIGHLAQQAGINLETVRYYERQGLLPRPPRTQSGYRAFPPDAARRIRFIKRAQELGFSLKEVKELLALRVDARTACAEVRRRAQAKVADVDEKIRSLRARHEITFPYRIVLMYPWPDGRSVSHQAEVREVAGGAG